jgi:hypothetical protein
LVRQHRFQSRAEHVRVGRVFNPHISLSWVMPIQTGFSNFRSFSLYPTNHWLFTTASSL